MTAPSHAGHDRAASTRAEDYQRLAAIVECTSDAVISKTLDGTVTSWNPAAERMFGYSAAEMLGNSIGVLIPADRRHEEQQVMQRLRGAQAVEQLDTLRLRRSGQAFAVSITFSPLWSGQTAGDGEIVGVATIIRDISERKQAEAAFDRERLFASMLLESLPGILYLYTEQQQFLRWNRSFEEVSGYSAAEVARMHPLDFFEPQYRELVASRIARALDQGSATVEAPFRSKDGSQTPYLLTGRRVPFAGQTCVVGMGIDVSERIRAYEALRESEARYRTTLDGILEGCQLLDFELRYLYLNETASVHNRRPNSELLGRTMPEAWPGIEASHVFEMLMRCLEARVPTHDETEFVFADGTSGWFDVRAQPVPEGVFVLSIDITERRRAEVALRELNESLELKVAERTHDLKEARERAESADRLKSAFLATMSHELRTPLNSIIGFSGILLQGLPGPLNPEQEKQLGMVQGSARHLLELINDVLDVSKIEAGQLEVRRAAFDLRESIERVVASVRPLAARKQLQLRLEMGPEVAQLNSDRRRVEQVLINLLNNAIKFTDRGSITLSVRHVATDFLQLGAAVCLCVADTGIGIAPADLPALFQPFRQIDSGLQRQHEGTGLGLAISRRLTELLGGRISVQSVAGQGSEFSVTLPLRGEQ